MFDATKRGDYVTLKLLAHRISNNTSENNIALCRKMYANVVYRDQ